MDERARRLWAGAEADAMGYGGVAAVARATSMAISTVRKGRDEVRAGARPEDVVNVRHSTGKRPYEVEHPEVWPALEKLVDPVCARQLDDGLARWLLDGHQAGAVFIGGMVIMAGATVVPGRVGTARRSGPVATSMAIIDGLVVDCRDGRLGVGARGVPS